jgi:Bacterial conjugation TrbI-like protein
MNDPQKTDKTPSNEELHEPLNDNIDEPPEGSSEAESGMRTRLRRLTDAMQHRLPAKADLRKDRTQSLALLIGATVAAVLLFLGVLSNPARSRMQEMATRTEPNLGRRNTGNQSASAQGSVTPLLNADVQSNNTSSDQLSPADIRGTSRSSESDGVTAAKFADNNRAGVQVPRRPASHSAPVNPGSVDHPDSLAGYRTNSTGAPTYSYGGSPGFPVGTEPSRTYSYSGGGFTPKDTRPDGSSSVKSSIVFVRASRSTAAVANTSRAATTPVAEDPLLPPGTRLVARLEVAATTAVKTPVVASIEYNYERDGMVIVPAGAKVIGDVQQASAEGYVSIRFHTLQMPNGREEKIEGTGVALDQRPLKGEVSGKNTGKKILSRTLSGVGTIAAYVVGARGAGLNRTITGETLLRDRVAGNIALAGEQELMNSAYAQNIRVTVPANTRFYVVFQKAAVSTTTTLWASQVAERSAQSAGYQLFRKSVSSWT